MKIYLIKYDNEHNFVYDSFDGHVIVANSISEVRMIAKDTIGAENKKIWNNAVVTVTGNYTGTKIKPFILLSSFNEG